MATALQTIFSTLAPFPMPRAVQRLFGIDEIERVYDALQSGDEARSIADRLLEHLAISCSVSTVDLDRVPRTGAAIVTVNHPYGILEGAVLASLLGRIRPDARFLANGLLRAIPEANGLIIPVDPMYGRKAVTGNGHGLRRALDHLAAGGLLVVFPAGAVSHFRWRHREVTDPEWNPAVARIVRLRPAVVVPAYVAGANGPLFQLAGMAHPALRTALLCRELLNKRGRTIDVRIGAPIVPDKLLAIPTAREQTDYLRWRTYLLASREPYKPRTSLPLRREKTPDAEPVAGPAPADVLAAEIAALPPDCLLNRSGDLEVYITGAGRIPHSLRELGRLREITFRAAGEGSGKALDLDEFDPHYLHLFVWNARKQEVVGAYRLAGADRVGRLYTSTLFRYRGEFLDRLGPALELGRSFVRQEYQRGFAPLLLLWKGIGAYIARNPRYKILFGPVSISNQYEAVSRELMVGFLEKYAMLRDWAGLVQHRCGLRDRVLKGARRPAFPSAGFDVEDLSGLVGEMEQKPVGVPVLLRQYLRLGGKLLGFNVDAQFANALDGLILVDLTRTEPRLLERYLGKTEAATFLEYQKGMNATH